MRANDEHINVSSDFAFIESVLQARGLHVDADALQRVERMLQGTLSRDQARAEIAAKYGHPLP
ncbi:hypothetical protein [Curtobacterium sp. MCSS17_007]|uniref:hypothetical protein n=1 Tax=Curtobacterium sp. MCSS17_007 TaxID=2175646 RepID=UPI000DAA861D|nr:hypothetical protein [Curtobacterium sp. MCSS17_007]WIE75194.1 hypothetical protein DEJ22_013175 [Curtobacterium sp. MCSS17_007]